MNVFQLNDNKLHFRWGVNTDSKGNALLQPPRVVKPKFSELSIVKGKNKPHESS